MIPALLVALREGVEAALVVGIVLCPIWTAAVAVLWKSYAWGGVILCVRGLAVAAAVLLQHAGRSARTASRACFCCWPPPWSSP